MNIKILDDLTLDIYIKNNYILNINFNNEEESEQFLKELFIKIKDIYNIRIEGFYEVEVLIDKYYGIIFHMTKEDIEYYNYFKNKADVKLSIINTEFLYQVYDIPIDLLKKVDVVIKNDNIYLKVKKKLSDIEMMTLMENSELVYCI